MELDVHSSKPVRMGNDALDVIDVQYSEVDELHASMHDPELPSTYFEPSGVEEILQAQIHDPFCSDIRRRLNEGGRLHLKSTMMESSSEPETSESKSCRTIIEGTHPSHQPSHNFSESPGCSQALPQNPKVLLLAILSSLQLRNDAQVSTLRKEPDKASQKRHETPTIPTNVAVNVSVFSYSW